MASARKSRIKRQHVRAAAWHARRRIAWRINLIVCAGAPGIIYALYRASISGITVARASGAHRGMNAAVNRGDIGEGGSGRDVVSSMMACRISINGGHRQHAGGGKQPAIEWRDGVGMMCDAREGAAATRRRKPGCSRRRRKRKSGAAARSTRAA